MTEYPKRPSSHQLESESEAFFRSQLPDGWVCERPSPDYGVDFHVHVVEAGRVLPYSFLVQLKASAQAPAGETIATELKISTYNLLWNRLEVAVIVKYVAAEKKAYWLLLKDVPAPSQDNKKFIVRIPRANKISKNQWEPLVAYVQDIHQRKLDVIRRGR
jgi:hypothetical protein